MLQKRRYSRGPLDDHMDCPDAVRVLIPRASGSEREGGATKKTQGPRREREGAPWATSARFAPA